MYIFKNIVSVATYDNLSIVIYIYIVNRDIYLYIYISVLKLFLIQFYKIEVDEVHSTFFE